MSRIVMGGTEAGLLAQLTSRYQGAPKLPHVHMDMLHYQMAALWGLAHAQCRKGGRILEIGTGCGGSTYMLAKAAPKAKITSITVSHEEGRVATGLMRLHNLRNAQVLLKSSAGFLAEDGLEYDMVYIDGNHNAIGEDLQWFNRVRVGGLLLCHDYSSEESSRASPIVFRTLNEFAERLGRPLDVLIGDAGHTGMAGVYRRQEETWAH